MMQMTLYSLTLISSLIFSQMNHPLAMGLMLLMQTVLISMLSGLMTKSFWFSYILFLIFIGGMLVLFIYVTSLASNEMFSFSMKLSIMFFIFLFMILIMNYFMDKSLIYSMFFNNEMQQLTQLDSYFMENSIMLNKLYNYPNNMITLLLMNYLLITMIAVIKITKLFFGPLRLMN